jgi:hypothetical protein
VAGQRSTIQLSTNVDLGNPKNNTTTMCLGMSGWSKSNDRNWNLVDPEYSIVISLVDIIIIIILVVVVGGAARRRKNVRDLFLD